MNFIVACIDHRLARLESAARTFLRSSDLHRREARAAVERDVFDGADALADAEAEQEVWEPAEYRCDTCAAPLGAVCATGPKGGMFCSVTCQITADSIATLQDSFWCAEHQETTGLCKARPHNVPADLAASGDSPAAECEPPSPAAGHSILLLKAAAIICDLQQYGPVSDARFKASVNPIIGRLHDAAWQLDDERAK